VLDDRNGSSFCRIELCNQFIGRVGVVDVVIGQLFALMLNRSRNTVASRSASFC
jgi:hypothetical protein